MLRSFLIGLVAGQRGMTPLAVVAGAARRGTLSAEMPGTRLLAHPVGAGGAVAMAAAEMTGDKMATAPDRTIPPGLIARAMSAGFAGAALAERRRMTSALVAATTAVAAAYAGLALRRYGMRRWGQTVTGFVEDAAVLAGGIAIARLPAR